MNRTTLNSYCDHRSYEFEFITVLTGNEMNVFFLNECDEWGMEGKKGGQIKDSALVLSSE